MGVGLNEVGVSDPRLQDGDAGDNCFVRPRERGGSIRVVRRGVGGELFEVPEDVGIERVFPYASQLGPDVLGGMSSSSSTSRRTTMVLPCVTSPANNAARISSAFA